jgi:hypothetical protein
VFIAHVQNGGVLDGRKDVPKVVRDELYKKEQHRLGRDKREENHVTGTRVPYPPNNINVFASQSTNSYRIDMSVPKIADNLQALGPLEFLLPGM